MSTAQTPTASPHPSLWRKLSGTPLRDLARGRLTSSLLVAERIAPADLPEPLARLAERIARTAGLTRGERADVAAELAAHFRDGLDAGVDAAELERGFGDPRRAATLIGRGKRRARSPVHAGLIWTGRGVLALIAVAVLWYGWLAMLYFGGEPRIERNFVAELHQKAEAIPEDERAWPLYRAALLSMTREAFDAGFDRIDDADPPLEGAELRDALAPFGEALRLAREGAERPSFGTPVLVFDDAGLAHWPGEPDPEITAWRGMADRPADQALSEPPFLINVGLPQLDECRRLALLLRADAQLAANEGDADRAAENLRAMIGMARQIAVGTSLVDQLVGISIAALACEELMGLLADEPGLFDDAQLARLAHALAGLSDSTLRVDLAGERMIRDDLLQRVYDPDSGRMTSTGMDLLRDLVDSIELGNEHTLMDGTLSGIVGPIAAGFVAPRDEIHRLAHGYYDHLQSRAETPFWRHRGPDVGQKLEDDLGGSDFNRRLRYLPIWLLMPAVDRAVRQADKTVQRRDAAFVAIALELYRRSEGAYPASLARLTPRFLPEVPADRFTGRPIAYRLNDAGAPMLYSVGVDRDDDGGRPALDERGDPDPNAAAELIPTDQLAGRSDIPDGDWVLFPPAKNGS